MTEEQFLEEFWDPHIRVVAARLREHGKDFLAGTNKPTVADFKMFGQVSMAMGEMNTGSIVPTEVQEKIRKKIYAVPCYRDWIRSMKKELNQHLSTRSFAL